MSFTNKIVGGKLNIVIDAYNQRIKFLDIAKGVGIILVVLNHSGIGLGKWIGGCTSSCYMALFFIIAGYLNKNLDISKKSFLKRVKKRAKRICYPYFVYNICLLFLYLPIAIGGGGALPADFIGTQIIGIFYSRKCFYYPFGIPGNVSIMSLGNGPLWFLTCMFISNILFYVIILYKKRYTEITIFTIIVTYLFSKLPVLLPWSLDTAAAGAFFMFVGSQLKFNLDGKNIIDYKKVLVILAFILCCRYNPGINMSVREYGPHGFISILLFLYCGIVGSWLIIQFCIIIESFQLSMILETVGKNSIPILALHMIILNYIKIFDSRYLENVNNIIIMKAYNYIKVALVIFIIIWGCKVMRNIVHTGVFARKCCGK